MLQTSEAARLKAIVAGKLTHNITVNRQIDSLFFNNMPRADQDALESDFRALSDAALIWHFPRDDKGRLERGKEIMLSAYPNCPEAKYFNRAQWLTVEGPKRLTDQSLVLEMRNTTGENFEHQWSLERWMWDSRERGSDLYKCWHIEDREKVKHCFDLLSKGAIKEAFLLYNTELDEHLAPLLEGKPASDQWRQYTKVWAPRLLENLMRSAPWRFALLLSRERQAREAWAKLKPNRKVEIKPIALFGLGGVTSPTRPQVFLASETQTSMRLILEWSGTQITAARPDWMRPIDYDLLQNGLITESSVP